MSSIPNVGLFQISGRRTTGRLFLPALYTPSGSSQISTGVLKEIYDVVVRPVMIDIIPESAARWPPCYDSAVALVRDGNGTMWKSGTEVPSWHLPELGRRLMEGIHALPWGKDAFFATEVRGTKGRTAHDPRDTARRIEVENEFFDFLDLPKIIDSWWLVDVGLEFSSPGRCFQWKSLCHLELIRIFMPGLSVTDVERLMTTDRYRKHTTAGLWAFGGFQAETIRRERNLSRPIHFFNVYTTEKNATYSLHKQGLFARRFPKDMCPDAIQKLATTVNRMTDLLHETDRLNFPGAARFEVRVPIKALRGTMANVTRATMTSVCRCIVDVPPTSLWYVVGLPSERRHPHPFKQELAVLSSKCPLYHHRGDGFHSTQRGADMDGVYPRLPLHHLSPQL